MEDLLDTEAPDVILHPSVLYGPFMHDLCYYSKRHGIPMVAIMNSWDNIASKANTYLKPDRVLVWGEQTKRHASKYLNMNNSKAVIFGAAQFDIYRNPPRCTREEFCQLHDISPDKTLLLYAGSNKITDEIGHLEILNNAIEAEELGNTVVIYRPHPWGGGGMEGSRGVDPVWRNVRVDTFMQGYMKRLLDDPEAISFPDYQDTVDVLNSIDAVISPLSTVLIEAAVMGKPVMCFLPLDENAIILKEDMELIHFKEIYHMPEFVKAVGRDQLVSGSKELLAKVGDAAFAGRLKEQARFFVESFETPYGERLVNYVESIARSSNR